MRRTLKNILLFAVMLLLGLQSCILIYAEGRMEEPKINLSLEVGFGGFYKLGYYAPFYFEIENNQKDINGELQVELPDEMGNITLYSMQVNLPSHSKKKFTMNIPINRYSTKLQVNITEGKSKLFTKSVRVDPGTNFDILSIGILSDDFESLRYINKIPVINNPQLGTRTIELNEDMLSGNADILNNFNLIVINNFDTAKLNKEKYEALKAWVVDGGLLLIGTGSSYSKTLGMFKDDFLTAKIGEVSSLKTKELNSLAKGNDAGENMELSVLDMSFKDSIPILQEGAVPLVVSIKKGNGNVAVAAFDFGLEPLAGWVGKSVFSERLMQKLSSTYGTSFFNKDMYMMNNIYAIDNSLRNIPELPKTKTMKLFIVLLGYILIVAPVSYIILRKMDKREWMWLSVPVVSLVFALAVYAVGFDTRINEPIINAINIVDFEGNDNAAPISYAGVFTPNKSNIIVEAAEDMAIRPLILNVQYGPMPLQDDKKQKQVMTKVMVSPKTAIEFYHNSVWSMKTLALSSNQNAAGTFAVDINYSKNTYSGSVKNNSEFDLDECYIITSHHVIDIGPIKKGEAAALNDAKAKFYNYGYDLINTIYKDLYAGRKPGQRPSAHEIDEFKRSMQKRQIMEFYLMNGINNGFFGAKLIGWSSTPITKDILVNGKPAKKYEKSFILADAAISFRTGDRVSYPSGYLQPEIVTGLNNGNYDPYGKNFYGRGTVEVKFQIDKDIEPDYVKLTYTINQGGRSPVKEYIWNVEKGAWEEGNYSVFYLTNKEKVSKYVAKDNSVRLKFELDDGSIQLPQIAVEGSVKNAGN